MKNYELEDIPQGVIDNIKEHYPNVVFDNYGKPFTEKCVSRKSLYKQTIEQNVDHLVVNAETFMPEMAHGVDVIESYVVRGEFDNDTADIYAVVSGGKVVSKNESHLGV